MERLQTLEELRTRKEAEEYFKQLGKEITEEELDALKQSYEKAKESNGALTLQQLDDVAGGKATISIVGVKNAAFYLFARRSSCGAVTELKNEHFIKAGFRCFIESDTWNHNRGRFDLMVNIYHQSLLYSFTLAPNELKDHYPEVYKNLTKNYYGCTECIQCYRTHPDEEAEFAAISFLMSNRSGEWKDDSNFIYPDPDYSYEKLLKKCGLEGHHFSLN